MVGLRVFLCPCVTRSTSSSSLLIGLLTFIIFYLWKTKTLDSLLSVSDVLRKINEHEAYGKNELYNNDGDFQQSLNVFRQQPLYKSLYNLLLKQIRVNIHQRFKDIPSDITFQPGHRIPIKDVRRVLIVSSYRSGSSFLGDLLQSYQGVFYSYEPLHFYLNNINFEKGKHIQKSLNLIKDISVCNLTSHEDYLTYLRKEDYHMKYNINYWQLCSLNPAFCFDPNFISDVCQYMPINVIKLVRLGLDHVTSLLQNQYLNFKIIHLVRDPRGSLTSRRKLSWCKHSSCIDPKTVCSNLLDDLHISKYFSTNYPDRYLLVRYEDLSINTANTAQDVFTFLGFTFYDAVKKFIETHTSDTTPFNVTDPYTTYRDSSRTAFAWRDSLSYDDMNGIQKHCQKPIEMLGFRYFETEDQYKNKNLSVIMRHLLIQ